MKAIWTGSLAFGLVNVPVKVYGTVEDHDVDLHQVHDADGGLIRYQRRCEVCGKKIEYEHIDKAYDAGERTVILTDEEMEALPAEKSREIEVVQFVPNDQIDPIMLERSYYLEPDSKSPKAYTLLLRTLRDTELTAVVKFALRQKTRLGALRVRGDVLVLQAMFWADEMREIDVPAAKKQRISARELKMSSSLVEQFRGDFTPEDFEDEYQLELRSLIEAKLERGDSVDTDATFGGTEAAGEDTGSGDVLDLMEALKRSIENRRSNTAAKLRRQGPATKAGAKATTKTRKKSTKTAKDKPPAKGAKKATGKRPAAGKAEHRDARKAKRKGA